MLDSWVHASIESQGVTETSKVVDVLLPLGRKQHFFLNKGGLRGKSPTVIIEL
jgi:hypothetical protein